MIALTLSSSVQSVVHLVGNMTYSWSVSKLFQPFFATDCMKLFESVRNGPETFMHGNGNFHELKFEASVTQRLYQKKNILHASMSHKQEQSVRITRY